MVAKSGKAALWQTIQRQHPEFARALKSQRAAEKDDVAIDCYPDHTNRWLMSALRSENPSLAQLLEERVLPDKEVLAAFCSPTVTVPVDDLISALLAFENRAAAA